MSSKFRNHIAGEWSAPLDGEYFENRNPADRTDVIGQWPRSSRADLERAIASAHRGFELWRTTPAPLRGDVIRKAGDILTSRKTEIAKAMTR